MAELLQSFDTLLIVADCPMTFIGQINVIQTSLFCLLVKARLVSGWQFLRPASRSQREQRTDNSGTRNLQCILTLLHEWQPEIQFPVCALAIRQNCLLSSSFNGKSHSCCQNMNVTLIYLFSHFTAVLGISGRSLYTHLINGNPVSNDLQSKLLIQEGTCTYLLFKYSQKHRLTRCHTSDKNFLQCCLSTVMSSAENITNCAKLKSCGGSRDFGMC